VIISTSFTADPWAECTMLIAAVSVDDDGEEEGEDEHRAWPSSFNSLTRSSSRGRGDSHLRRRLRLIGVIFMRLAGDRACLSFNTAAFRPRTRCWYSKVPSLKKQKLIVSITKWKWTVKAGSVGSKKCSSESNEWYKMD